MSLRNLPSVEELIQHPALKKIIQTSGRPLVVDVIRSILDEIRSRFTTSGVAEIPAMEALIPEIVNRARAWTTLNPQTVINATGVILHTNLGRALLSNSAIQAIIESAGAYSNLEFDLKSGKRGGRIEQTEKLLSKLTGAESALVVNNNAAAMLLTLTVLANKKEAIISRSQLIEIGGGFRVPDVMKQSGAKLVEVGTTNKIRLADFENAIGEKTALVMRAHRSNFKIIGFTSEPNLKDIVTLAHKRNVIVLDDLGSGALLDTVDFGMAHEPTVQESVSVGVDIVCFSGDKLLGGPQCGIIVGKAELISKISKHPLARALRADKMTLAALNATLIHYLKTEAQKEIPVWQMISATVDDIKSRAENWQRQLGIGELFKSESTVGGGSLPGETLPTWVLALNVKFADNFLAKLRDQTPPIVARIENNKILFDPRTVLPAQENSLVASLKLLTSEN